MGMTTLEGCLFGHARLSGGLSSQYGVFVCVGRQRRGESLSMCECDLRHVSKNAASEGGGSGDGGAEEHFFRSKLAIDAGRGEGVGGVGGGVHHELTQRYRNRAHI